MSDNGPPGLFITGTDTGVGKTHVAAILAMSLRQQGYRVGVYKPAASGCNRRAGDVSPPVVTCEPDLVGRSSAPSHVDLVDELISDDALALWEAAGKPGELVRVCPQRFAAPLAPHLAARAEGTRVDEQLLRSGLEYWRERSDVVIVEGAGGLMSPISDEDFVADLVYEFGYPLVVVAANRIGVINQVLQTLIVAQTFREGIPIAGIVLNETSLDPDDLSRASNYDELCRYSVPPVLTQVASRASAFDRDVDWMKLAQRV